MTRLTTPAPSSVEEYARRLVQRLDRDERPLPHDIQERLRFARERAVAVAAARRREAWLVVQQANAAAAISAGSRWWRLASFAPLILLAAGLVVIDRQHRVEQILAAAEMDAVLLADELPPSAYTDPGFVEFLRRAEP